MQNLLPNVEHPTTFVYGTHRFKVRAYCKLTDTQAANVVRHHCRTNKLPRAGKVITLLMNLDEHSAHMFG